MAASPHFEIPEDFFKTMKIIDISVPIDGNLPLWPRSLGFKFSSLARIGKNNPFNESHLGLNAHVGTHMDAPLHFVAKGSSIDQTPLEICFGPATVAYLPNVKSIGVAELSGLKIPRGTKRILFKTDNSKLWQKKERKFHKDYVGLTAAAAEWLAKKGIKLVGIDYLSIAKMEEAVEVHQILLGRGMHILEGLDLSKASSGEYQLVALPLRFTGLEASPLRAILIKK